MVAGRAKADYGMIIPSDPMVTQEDGRSVALTVWFSHPVEGTGTDLAPLMSSGVWHGGQRTTCSPSSSPRR